MRAQPSERFLGVPAHADAWTLLGVDARTTLDEPTIARALRSRLAMIDRHPGGASSDALQLRESLSRAADELRSQIGKPPPSQPSQVAATARSPAAVTPRFGGRSRPARPAISLTEFDRQVLGTLVGSGGWNHASRSRLVSIAAAHRVTVQGLLTVIRGLNDYARSGGSRLDVATITAGKRMLSPASVDLPRKPTTSLAERLLPELKDPTPATTVKWSLIFGAIAIVSGAVLIAIVMSGRSRPVVTPPILDDDPLPTVVQHGEGTEDPPQLSRTPATYPQPTTFTVDMTSLIPASRIEECARLPEELDHIARRVRVSDEPAEAMFHDWEAFIDLASATWVSLDESLDQRIASGVRRVFEEAVDKPAVGERLLNVLGASAGNFIQPIDAWRSSWRIQRLAELSQSLRISPALRERSDVMLSAALTTGVDPRLMTPAEVASTWLADISPTLVRMTESSDSPYEMWALWLAAVQRVSVDGSENESLTRAVEAILASRVDLTNQKASVNVLGRLLTEMDWRTSAIVRQRVISWFDIAGGISSDDLWVLSSMLVQMKVVPWFAESLLLPRGADDAHRRRVRDQIASAWPRLGDEEIQQAGPAGRGIDVEPQLGAQWLALKAELLNITPVGQPVSLATHLALLTRLNEAASVLERGETQNAERVMDWIADSRASESVLSGGSALSSPRWNGSRPGTRKAGQAIGQDGVWAAAYEQAGAAADARSNMLRSLRATAGTDLGPVDAATFVRAAYRATPADVRELAQSVAMTFAYGPNVSQQLLDQLPDAIPNDDTSEFLQRFTGQTLPAVRTEEWRIESRLTLIHHCLSLLPSTEGEIDRAADIIADAVARQVPSDMPDLVQQAAHATPADAAELIRQAWADAMRSVVVAEPVPGDIQSIERRHRSRKHLAAGPIQSFLASRIGHLELFAFAITAEQPSLRVTVKSVLETAEAKRAHMPDVLQQAIEVEKAIAQLHGLRMRFKEGGPS